jgi:uncharacterized protein YgiM (DUF1202 family)
MAILFIIAGSALSIIYRFTNSVSIKKLSFYSALVLLLFGFASMFVANSQDQYFDAHHSAIIFSTSVNVKSGPTPGSKNLFLIHDGTKVEILENNNGWMKIRLASGNEGWINASDAKEI